MPSIEVKMFEGRTREQKADLARRFADAPVEVTGCPAEAVSIAFSDFAKSDWAKAGRLCDE
jgi:4-oxalocrotonate tautomerase